MDISKKSLAVALSRLETFNNPAARLEQYSTDSEIASDVLWHAFMAGQLRGKIVVDLGAGTGILGIGCLLLGAKKAHFVEIDPKAIAVLRKNLASLGHYEIHEKDVADYCSAADIVIMNPPFGTKRKGTDIMFLEKAADIAGTIYTLHKTSTIGHVKKKAGSLGLEIIEQLDFSYPLKNTLAQHRKKIQRIEVSCLALQKNI